MAGRQYPPELRERAVRMVLEHQHEYPSQWTAIISIAGKFGMTCETLRRWVRQAEVDDGTRTGLTSDERERLKELERENRELRRANEPSQPPPRSLARPPDSPWRKARPRRSRWRRVLVASLPTPFFELPSGSGEESDQWSGQERTTKCTRLRVVDSFHRYFEDTFRRWHATCRPDFPAHLDAYVENATSHSG